MTQHRAARDAASDASAAGTPVARISNVAIINFVAKRSHQLDLALHNASHWGGSRAGAGRKPTGTAGIRHGSRDRFPRPLPAHVTLRMQPHVPSLRTVPIVHEIERSFARGCTRPGFRLVHYSLQGNHAHLIAEAQDGEALGRGMKAIGARLARAVNRIAKRSGAVLADRYHSRVLKTPREVHRALRYVLLNARRHLGKAKAAAVRAPRELLDPASSARSFDGWKPGKPTGRRDGTEDLRSSPPVARAQTWLLTVGWRRWGLLDPTETPGASCERR
jgi:REP element-mobilizing transposase RayT